MRNKFGGGDGGGGMGNVHKTRGFFLRKSAGKPISFIREVIETRSTFRTSLGREKMRDSENTK